MAAGLQTQIWNNNLKSIVLLALYPFILMAVIWAAASAIGLFMFGSAQGVPDPALQAGSFGLEIIYQYWPAIITGVLLWFIVSYFLHGAMMRALSHAHPVTRKEEPDLYNLLENLCISVGMTMPRLEIIETHARNAFASGINQKTYCVTVTRGLMQSLTRDELEAVLAHELTHIRNHDVRLLMVCVIFTGMIGFAAQLLWSYARYAMWVPRSSSGNQRGGMVMVLFVVVAILWMGYLATVLTRFALSRRREFMADAGAVQMTKRPEAMMGALMRIAGMADIPKLPGDVTMMFIENTKAFLGVFATHPPIEARIQAIATATATPVPAIAPKARADDDVRFQPPQGPRANWATRQRFKGRRRANPWIDKPSAG